MAMFKQKNKKILISDKRVTLDAKHNEIIKKFRENTKQLSQKLYVLEEYELELKKIENNEDEIIDPNLLFKKFKIQNKIDNLKAEIKNLESKEDETQYFIKTGKILYNYYDDIYDLANNKSETKNKSQEKPIANFDSNIMNFFKTDSPNTKSPNKKDKSKSPKKSKSKSPKKDNNKPLKNCNDQKTESKIDNNLNLENEKIDIFLEKDKNGDRATQLDSYMKIIDKSYCSKNKASKNIDYCKKCFRENKTYNEMLLNPSDGNIICTKCGYMEFVVIDSDKPSYKDPPPEATYFAYKRINHFNELLNQIQAKESTDIPKEVFDHIQNEIRKERITDLSKLNNVKIKSYLKKLRYNKYYEHIPHIINKLNGLPPPILTREVEEKLRIMFREIQGPFMEICPPSRKNFLNYYYVFYKFIELLGLDEYKSLFPLLKSREKLHQQDIMWKMICAKLNWQYIRSI